MLSDIEISKNAKKLDIREIAKKLDIDEKYLELYWTNKAKLSSEFLQKIKNNKNWKLILVTACNPIPAWEGKTTTTIWLGQAMWKIGKKSAICLREVMSNLRMILSNCSDGRYKFTLYLRFSRYNFGSLTALCCDW